MIHHSLNEIAALIGVIYEAAYDRSRWQKVVTDLGDLFDGSRTCISRFRRNSVDAVMSVADPDLLSQETIEALLRDPIYGTSKAEPVGVACRRPSAADEAAFREREIWLNCFRPRDMHHGIACNLASSSDAYWFVDIQRGARQPAFEDADVDLLQKIAPHILRAGQIGRNFQAGSLLALSFSHLPFGVVVVDGHQRIVQMNEAAETILAHPGSLLRASGDEIQAANFKDAQPLRKLVANACAAYDDLMPGKGGTLLLRGDREQPDRPELLASITPFVHAPAYGLAPEHCAMIMLREVSFQVSDGFADHIRILFELTPAEATLAAALAAGYSLKDAAASSGITVKTSRTYLERIFAKTRTRQQSQLVALLKSTEPFR
ncbi:helix-turn-helix transcriptional regulator [Mesorhizobium sp. PAMC28654]|uniref:helix-turn-helix transcriptional regulator n=1 Tax=Mesorhizobium sp. PAMC28654 TaxID=2880934 RepID=UPI001D0A5198|nr:helix-turn-helix transcriptional regulator [Mesorhizobium sp. PAMC28654]UDL87941.1 helix-turn-helix transcriptional regulator [Mesorhizobium sp. PAMC28654]